MAANQLDSIMSQVQRLSTYEQLQIIKRVADLLGKVDQPSEAQRNGATKSPLENQSASPLRTANLRDFTADRQWLAAHRDEYAGQWVALKDGQLISSGTTAKEVHQAAQAAGHLDALLVRVEASDAPPFIL